MARFEFTKDGHTYTINAENRYYAKIDLEVSLQVNLDGADWKEYDKHHKLYMQGKCERPKKTYYLVERIYWEDGYKRAGIIDKQEFEEAPEPEICEDGFDTTVYVWYPSWREAIMAVGQVNNR